MDKPQLLAEFKAQVEAFDKFQGFIDKAREKSDKFRPEVVEKVVRDNTEKIDGVAAALEPLVVDMESVIAELGASRLGVDEAVADARLGLEELELRKEIGELDDDAFGAEASGFQGAIGEAATRLEAIDRELVEFRETLQGWLDRRPLTAATVTTTARVTLVADPEDDLLGDLEDDIDAAFAGESDRGEAVHARVVELADDVSAVFEEPEPAPVARAKGRGRAAAEEEDDEVIEAAEAPADEGISFGDDELGDLGGDSAPTRGLPMSELAGQAVLIQSEGTDEEHAYPFAAGVISLGRGRDNTVQVKNDSKVSRYHCKLVQKHEGYFIEDNKSANGTLVDGELITEKRLLGGEEVIIGETFFRFRINP